jgi:hypothetical protein
MSKHSYLIFETKEEALKALEENVGHPYRTLMGPIELKDGRFALNVTIYELD